MMCKHYNTPQGCSYGDKCQFAHGPQELRVFNGPMTQDPTMEMTKSQKSMINYKIVKCKNWEKDGTCKYGHHCTFAHGDNDLRDKNANLFQMQPNMMMMYPLMMNMNMMPMDPAMQNIGMQNMNMDINQMQQMTMAGQIDPNQLMMGVNMNPQGIDMNIPQFTQNNNGNGTINNNNHNNEN